MSESNGQGPRQVTEAEMAALEATAPRPVPTGWTLKPVVFSNGQGDRRVMVELSILTPTGVHITFWAPADLARLSSDLRSATKEAASGQSGIITPQQSGLIVPPTTGG